MASNNLSAWERMKEKTRAQQAERGIKQALSAAPKQIEAKEEAETFLSSVGQRENSVIGQMMTDSKMAYRAESRNDNSLWKQTEKDRVELDKRTEKLMKDLNDQLTKYRADNDTDKIVETQKRLTELQKQTDTHWTDRVGNTVGGALKQSAGAYGSAFAVTTEDMLDGGRVNVRGESMDKLSFDKNKALQYTQGVRDKTMALTQSGAADIEQAKKGLGTLGRLVVDTASGLTQLGADIGIGAATGLGAMPALAVRAFGGAADQAKMDGASVDQQVAYGLASAAVEVFAERLSSYNLILDKTHGKSPFSIDKFLDGVVAGIEDIATTPGGRALMNCVGSILASGMGEGFEEAISGIAEPFLSSGIYGKEFNMDIKEIGYQVLIGALTGAVTGVSGKSTLDYRISKADESHGQVIRDTDMTPRIVRNALHTDKNSEAYKMADAIRSRKAPATNEELGKLNRLTLNQLIKEAEAVEQAQSADLGQPVSTKTATVLDTGTSAYVALGMKTKRAEAKAKVVQKLINGEEVSLDGMKSLNLTDAKYREIFTQLTGVVFPEGMTNHDQLMNIAKTANTVSRVEQVDPGTPVSVQTEVQEPIAQDIAQDIAQVSDEAQPLSYEQFGEAYRRTEGADLSIDEPTMRSVYDSYLEHENQTVMESGAPVTRTQFRSNMRKTEAGAKMSDREIDRYFDSYRESQTEAPKDLRHKLSKDVQDVIATFEKKLGIRIEVTESIRSEKTGQIAEGVSDPGIIRLALDARGDLSYDEAVMQVLRHEVTHQLKRAVTEDTYNAFAKYVREFDAEFYQTQYEKVSKTYDKQFKGSDEAKKQADIDDEVIARCAEKLFEDEAFIRMVVGKNRTLAEKIHDVFEKLLKKLNLTGEAKKKLQAKRDLWAAMLNEAEENTKAGVAYDKETESFHPAQFSLDTWNESDYVTARAEAAKAMSEALGITQKKAKDYIDSVNSIAKMIANDRVRLDYEASPGRSSFVNNAEYGGSIDFSTICKKRRLFTGTFEAIQRALPNTALTAEEFLEIRSMMDEKGYEVSCGLCYVEGSRAKMGQYTKQFLERYAATNPEYVPTMAEMNTATGQEQIRREHPEVYEAYERFMNNYGRLNPTDKAIFASQQKPKMYQMSTAYQGEILNKFGRKSSKVTEKNLNGGLRIQSFSDFEIIHLIDMMQVIMDMSRVGLSGQAYTKVPDFAWALGDTGLKINLSLITKGLDENGKLILDEKEGMSAADAFALRDRYSENVGTILVVYTDDQLKAALADDRIDYIIPFHKSQWKMDQYELMGIPAEAKNFNYEKFQNESYIKPVLKNGKKQRPENFMPNTYWDFSKSGKENAETYLRMCAEDNRRPKFHHLLVDNKDGSYALQPDGSTDGYWKLLIDFKMYDNDGKGVPQRPVRPDFNMEQAYRMLEDYKGGHSRFPTADDVVSEFVEQYKRNHPDVRYSYADEYVGTNPELAYLPWENQVDLALEGKLDGILRGRHDYESTDPDGKYLTSVLYVAKEPSALLQEVGLSDLPLVLTDKHLRNIVGKRWDDNGRVINRHNHEIPVGLVKRLPELIRNPLAIFASDPNGTSKGGIVILTDEVDAKGNPVCVTITPDQPSFIYDGKQGPAHFVNMYGRENADDFINAAVSGNSVLYVDEKWASSELSRNNPKLGAATQAAGLTSAYNTIVREKDPTVKPGERQFSLVEDQETLDFLNNQEWVKVYRAMWQDPKTEKLYPPMGTKQKDTKTGKLKRVDPIEWFTWYASDEKPELIKFEIPKQYVVGEPTKNGPREGKRFMTESEIERNKDVLYGESSDSDIITLDSGKTLTFGELLFKFELKKADGGSDVPAAYNPYFHTSLSALNDQFSSAYKRPGLVVVEGYIPKSELTSRYQAKYAKDPVGETTWHEGPVAGQLKGDNARKVYLSRYFRAERIVEAPEAAQMIAKVLKDEDIKVPWNVVTPKLREALVAEGVGIDYSDIKVGKKTVGFNDVFPTEDPDLRYSFADDEAYLSVVERGDMETAQRMVDEAAKAAGYNHRGYRGEQVEWNVFDMSKAGTGSGAKFGKGVYLALDRSIAEEYAYNVYDYDDVYDDDDDGVVREFYAKLDNPYIFDYEGEEIWKVAERWFETLDRAGFVYDHSIKKDYLKTATWERDVVNLIGDTTGEDDNNTAELLSRLGYDGVVSYGGYELVVYNPAQVKSVDPVTYDDNGNVIPLSKRFDSSNEDIRYSLADDLTPEKRKAFIETFDAEFGEGAAEQMFKAHDQMARAAARAEKRAEKAAESKKAAETLAKEKSERDLTAFLMYHNRKLREQQRKYADDKAKLQKAKAEAVKEAVETTKLVERAKADIRVQATEMHLGKKAAERERTLKERMVELKAEAAERLRVTKDTYRGKMKEMSKLQRNAAKHLLSDSAAVEKRKAEIKKEQGPIDTIRKNPRERVKVEKMKAAAEALRTLHRAWYRNFVNAAQGIDNFAKRQKGGFYASDLVTLLGGSGSAVERIFKSGLTDREGNRIADSLKDVLLCMDATGKKVDEAKQALLQDYILHLHNIDRMSFVAKAKARLDAFEGNPENAWLVNMDVKELAKLVAATDAEVADSTAAKLSDHGKVKRAEKGKSGWTEADRQLAQEYASLLHNYREAQDKPVFADENGNPVTADTSREIVAKYEAENPWLIDKANGIFEWWDLFMRTWAVGDSLSLAEYETMHETYPHYAPTYRVGKAGPGGANSVNGTSASVSKATKAAKGSTLEIVPIEDSFANIVSKIVRLARTNQLYMNIIDTAMLDEEGLFSDMAVFDWDWHVGEYAKALQVQNILDGETAEEIEAATKVGLTQEGKDYYISGWKDGRVYRAKVHKDLFTSIADTTGYSTSEVEKMFLKAGNALTGPMKTAITGANPAFSVRNTLRDLPTAIINSTGPHFLKYWKQAGIEMLNNSENWQVFQALGGVSSGYYNNNKGFAHAMSLNPNAIQKVKGAFEWFGNNSEAITRFAEYLSTIDRLGDTYEARVKGIKNAAEVTVDFSRSGRVGRHFNVWIPYWNPAIQGTDKLLRSVFDAPDGSTLLKQAMKTGGRAAMNTALIEVILQVVLHALDRDDEWEELSDRDKAQYYCIPLVDEHKFLKIPKNREWGAILGTPVMLVLESIDGRPRTFETVVESYWETSLEPNFLPPAVLRPDFKDGGFSSDIIGVSWMAELGKNEDFAGRAIVPYSLEQGSRTEQYNDETSVLIRKVAQSINFSPMQLQYMLTDYFGDFGKTFAYLNSPSFKDNGDNIITAAWSEFFGSFEGDNRYSNQTVSSYYEAVEELDRVVQDKKNHGAEGEYLLSKEYKTQKGLEELYGKQITELNKEVRGLPDGPDKDALKEEIARLAGEAMDYYNRSMTGEIAEPQLTAKYAALPTSVSNELIRLDSFAADYAFEPTGTASSKYTDPEDKKREYVMTGDDEAKDVFRSLYFNQYGEVMTEVMDKTRYQKANDQKKVEMLEEARDTVLERTKDDFFDWLAANRRSTLKK